MLSGASRRAESGIGKEREMGSERGRGRGRSVGSAMEGLLVGLGGV